MSKHALQRNTDTDGALTRFKHVQSGYLHHNQPSAIRTMPSSCSRHLLSSGGHHTVQHRALSSQTIPPARSIYKYQVLDPHVPYHVAHRWMNELVLAKTRRDNPEERDILFIVQHAPVYTLGKGASLDNVMFDTTARQPFDVQRIERGGEVTYHGPGQLTVYPIINLKRYRQDLHWYVTQLESVVMHTLESYGISSHVDQEHPGVWVGPNKVAALGCRFSRWVTMHGFALNVTSDVLGGFRRIVPCGIHDRGVTTMQSILARQHEIIHEAAHGSRPDLFSPSPAGPEVDMETVAQHIADAFEQVFDVAVIESDHVNMFYDASLERTLAEAKQKESGNLMLSDVYQGSIDLI